MEKSSDPRTTSILSEVLDIEEKGKAVDCVACGKYPEFSRKFCQMCVKGGPMYPVPDDAEFLNADGEFLLDPVLGGIGERLMKAYPEDLRDVAWAKIAYVWKRKGGTKGGNNVLGRLKKVSGELKFYSQVDYLVVLSADHCQLLNLYQVTALIFHELLHGFRDEKGKYSTVGHDFEGFRREVELFGFWKPDITAMNDSFHKGTLLPLFDIGKRIEAL